MHEAGRLLLLHGKEAIWAHSQAVAAEAALLAERFALDRVACETAAYCHDIGGITPAVQMLERARELGWEIDPSEARYPFLLHQRFSALYARELLGITDTGVCEAIGCHTTLRPQAAAMDMAVFLADKLAWDQPGRPPYEASLRAALQSGLPAACLFYMETVLSNGSILMPHQWLLQAVGWLRETVR